MEVVWGAIISASVFLAIPLFGWFSRRATKEGRLTLRVERMGVVYTAMPESDERTTFEAHYRAAIDDLNRWLDVDAKFLRQTVRAIYAFFYILGIVLFITVGRLIPPDSFVFNFLFGVLMAVVIGGGSFGSQYLLERRASSKQARERQVAKEKAFRDGNPLTK